MLLLRELTESVEYLVEADQKTGAKKYFLEGTFLQGVEPNKNGRIYPIEVLENEVAKYNENYVTKNRAFGELDHPATPSVNLKNASHLITKLTREGNNFIGRAVILDTTMGREVKSLMEGGCSLGVSSRGMGALKEKNGSKVVEQYYMTTAADIVADPSAQSAFPENVFESVEWILTNEGWVKQERGYNLVQELKKVSKQEREERFLREFHRLLTT